MPDEELPMVVKVELRVTFEDGTQEFRNQEVKMRTTKQSRSKYMLGSVAKVMAEAAYDKKLREDAMKENNGPRPIHVIAKEIGEDWTKMSYHARPYWEAMTQLDKPTDNYGLDSAKSVVTYFLSNAQSWRGEKAREIKAELKEMMKGVPW